MKNVCLTCAFVFGIVVGGDIAQGADEADEIKGIQALINQGKADEAEAAFQATLKKFPNSDDVKELHWHLKLMHSGRNNRAMADHGLAFIQYQLDRMEQGKSIGWIASAIGNTCNAFQSLGQVDEGLAQYDRVAAALEAKIKTKPTPELIAVLYDVRDRKILRLSDAGQRDEADKLLQLQFASARQDFAARPNDAAAAARLADLLRTEAFVLQKSAPEQAGAAYDRFLQFVGEQARRFPHHRNLVVDYIQGHYGSSRSNRYSQSSAAEIEKLLDGLQEARAFMNTLDPQEEDIKRSLAHIRQAIPSVEQSMIVALASKGKADHASRLLAPRLAAAEREFQADAENAFAAVHLARMKFASAEISRLMPEPNAEALRRELVEFAAAQWKRYPENSRLFDMVCDGYLLGIDDLIATNPNEAERRLESLKEFLKSVKATDAEERKLTRDEESINHRVRYQMRSFANYEREIARARRHLALVGKPALALDVAAWINGTPLSDSDLKGKVVLLDFWAVWCGPCIGTFPHLRDWHENYADKGLVILGVTEHYEYDWDADEKRSKKSDGFKPDQENAALQKFAEHYRLKHRLAVTPPDSEFSESYGVTGIPHVVLIDRSGSIRLIRVGNTEENARDIEAMINKLLE